MKVQIALLMLPLSGLFAADDPWTKQRGLKSGTEVRVYKRAVAKPVVGKLDEVREDSIVMVVKDTQVSISKDDVDRLDARPEQTASRMRKETKTETTYPTPGPGTPGLKQSSGAPEGHTSSSLTFGSKPDFETVYRRVAVSGKKE